MRIILDADLMLSYAFPSCVQKAELKIVVDSKWLTYSNQGRFENGFPLWKALPNIYLWIHSQ